MSSNEKTRCKRVLPRYVERKLDYSDRDRNDLVYSATRKSIVNVMRERNTPKVIDPAISAIAIMLVVSARHGIFISDCSVSHHCCTVVIGRYETEIFLCTDGRRAVIGSTSRITGCTACEGQR